MSELIGTDKSQFTLVLDQEVYSLTVVQKACYSLMHYMSCLVSISGGNVIVKANPSPEGEKPVSELESLLMDELLDYSLRETISQQTETVRNLILSNAFSNTKLIS